MSEQKVPVWTWRDAIRKANVPPLTKLVCHTLSLYISDIGEGCYPGTKRLMEDTGLSNRALAAHLKRAKDEGLLEIKREVGKSGRFEHNHYYPRFPNNVDLPRVDGGNADVSQNQVTESHLAKPSDGKSSGPSDFHDKNRVTQPSDRGSHELSTKNYPKNCSASRAKSKSEKEKAMDVDPITGISARALAEGYELAEGWDHSELLDKFLDLPEANNPDKAWIGFCRRVGAHEAVRERTFRSSVPREVIERGAKALRESGPTTITPGHCLWTHWLDWLRCHGHRALADEIENARGMTAPAILGAGLPTPIKVPAKRERVAA